MGKGAATVKRDRICIKLVWYTLMRVNKDSLRLKSADGSMITVDKKNLPKIYRVKYFPEPAPTPEPTVSGTTASDFFKATVPPVVPTLKTYKVVLEIDGCVGPKFAEVLPLFSNKSEASAWVVRLLNQEGSYVNIGNVGFNKEDLICFSVYEPK